MLKRQMYSYCGFANMLRLCLSFSIKLNSVFTTPRKYFLAGYKSQYNVESLYPGSNLNFNLQPLQKASIRNRFVKSPIIAHLNVGLCIKFTACTVVSTSGIFRPVFSGLFNLISQ